MYTTRAVWRFNIKTNLSTHTTAKRAVHCNPFSLDCYNRSEWAIISVYNTCPTTEQSASPIESGKFKISHAKSSYKRRLKTIEYYKQQSITVFFALKYQHRKSAKGTHDFTNQIKLFVINWILTSPNRISDCLTHDNWQYLESPAG